MLSTTITNTQIVMERAPRKVGEVILPTRLFVRLVIAGVIIAVCTLGVMQYEDVKLGKRESAMVTTN